MTRIPLAKIHLFQKAWHKTHSSPSLQPSVHLSHLATSFSTVAKTFVQQERKGKARKFLLLLILSSLDKDLPFVFSCLAPTSSNWSRYRPTDSLMLYEGQAVSTLLAHPSSFRKTAKEGVLQHCSHRGPRGRELKPCRTKLNCSLPSHTPPVLFFLN